MTIEKLSIECLQKPFDSGNSELFIDRLVERINELIDTVNNLSSAKEENMFQSKKIENMFYSAIQKYVTHFFPTEMEEFTLNIKIKLEHDCHGSVTIYDIEKRK